MNATANGRSFEERVFRFADPRSAQRMISAFFAMSAFCAAVLIALPSLAGRTPAPRMQVLSYWIVATVGVVQSLVWRFGQLVYVGRDALVGFGLLTGFRRVPYDKLHAVQVVQMPIRGLTRWAVRLELHASPSKNSAEVCAVTPDEGPESLGHAERLAAEIRSAILIARQRVPA